MPPPDTPPSPRRGARGSSRNANSGRIHGIHRFNGRIERRFVARSMPIVQLHNCAYPACHGPKNCASTRRRPRRLHPRRGRGRDRSVLARRHRVRDRSDRWQCRSAAGCLRSLCRRGALHLVVARRIISRRRAGGDDPVNRTTARSARGRRTTATRCPSEDGCRHPSSKRTKPLTDDSGHSVGATCRIVAVRRRVPASANSWRPPRPAFANSSAHRPMRGWTHGCFRRL